MTLSQFERKQGQLRAALEAAVARLAPHFPNPAARATAAAYLQSLLSDVERKNSWQLAEAAGLANPYPFQHLLSPRAVGCRGRARRPAPGGAGRLGSRRRRAGPR
jgi:hypothetical protein